MKLTEEMIVGVLDRVTRRCQAAIAAGGIPHEEAEDGRPVPDGWHLDPQIAYWLPPGVSLL